MDQDIQLLSEIRDSLRGLPNELVLRMERARGGFGGEVESPAPPAALGTAAALPGLGELPAIVSRLGEIAERLEAGGQTGIPAAQTSALQQPGRIEPPDPREAVQQLHQAAETIGAKLEETITRPGWLEAEASPPASIPPVPANAPAPDAREREQDALTELVRDMDQRFRPEWTERTEESPSAALLMSAAAESGGAKAGGTRGDGYSSVDRPDWTRQTPADSPAALTVRGRADDVERPAWAQHGTSFSPDTAIGTTAGLHAEPSSSGSGAAMLAGNDGAAMLGGGSDVAGILEKLTAAVEKLTDAIESSGRGDGRSGGKTVFGTPQDGPLQRVSEGTHPADLEANEGFPQASPSVNVSVIPGSGGAGGYGLGSRRPAPAPLVSGGRGRPGASRSRSGFTEPGQRPGGDA